MLLGAFALMSSVFVACDKYDDDIKGLQTQIDELKASVASLQSAIDGGAVITNVTANAEGIVVTLSNGSNYTIKNGKDGQNGKDGVNGQDGKNGSVVTIGENGNWFIDGVDTGKPSQGAKGDKGETGAQGPQGEQGVAGPQGPQGPAGANGTNGTDGKDADQVYFVPCTDKECENYGKWEKFVNGVKDATYVGESWMHEGVLTAIYNSETGALEFHGVEGVEDGIVVIENIAVLTSLAIIPEEILSSTGLPIFYNYLITALNEDDEEFLVASNNLKMSYRVNPTNADLTGVDYSFINRTVKVRATGDNEDLLTLVSAENVNGELKVEAKVNKIVDFYANKTANIFALKAKTENGDVVSDYATVQSPKLVEFGLVNIYANKANWQEGEKWDHVLEYTDAAPAADDTHYEAAFKYTGSIDLDDVVALAELDKVKDLVADLGFEVEYTFEKLAKYAGVDKVTNQNKFVTIDENNVVKVDNEWLAKGTAAVGRTPVFKVTASVEDVVLATAYIKLYITETDPVVAQNIVVNVEPKSYEYCDLKSTTVLPLSWEQFNTDVLEVLGMSIESFTNVYTDGAYAKRPVGTTAYWDGVYETTSTDAVSVTFDPTKLFPFGEQDTVKVVLKSNLPELYGNVQINFMYTINHTPKFPALNSEYVLENATVVEGEEFETVRVKGKLVNDVWTLQAEMKEFFADYLAKYKVPGNHSPLEFAILGRVNADGTLTRADMPALRPAEMGAVIENGSDYTAAEIKLTEALAGDEPSRTYLIKMVQNMANFNEYGVPCEKYFAVEFVRPFDVEVADIVLKTFTALPDSAHVDSLVVVKDLDGKVLYEKCKVTKYAENTYKFTQAMFDGAFTYSLAKLDNTWGFANGDMKLKLVANPETGENTVIEWYNGGGDLQQDKVTDKLTVTLDIAGLAAEEQKVNVKVLSTANSKK